MLCEVLYEKCPQLIRSLPCNFCDSVTLERRDSVMVSHNYPTSTESRNF